MVCVLGNCRQEELLSRIDLSLPWKCTQNKTMESRLDKSKDWLQARQPEDKILSINQSFSIAQNSIRLSIKTKMTVRQTTGEISLISIFMACKQKYKILWTNQIGDQSSQWQGR